MDKKNKTSSSENLKTCDNELVERRKKKRRDRRKTNSESSCTKVDMSSFSTSVAESSNNMHLEDNKDEKAQNESKQVENVEDNIRRQVNQESNKELHEKGSKPKVIVPSPQGKI